MAAQQSHMSFSFFLAILYAIFGFFFLALSPEALLLASVVVVIAGLLPNVDGGQDGAAKEFAGLLAAVLPLLILQSFPSLQSGGVARMALVVVCAYLISRVFVVRFLQTCTVRRGIVHSIPAAIITAEIVYLVFYDLPKGQRAYLFFAALLGFLSHLLLDAYSNFDLIGKASGQT
ncbi:MAG TPA: metal-dependent hydrolase, partial [Oligoflexia bacterium]|nr:metal-dependent hydrolase [Oligoflexia bacterium]